MNKKKGNQTEKLRSALYEFLKRNPEERRVFEEHDPSFRKWYLSCGHSEAEYEEIFKACMARPAAFVDLYINSIAWVETLGKIKKGIYPDRDELNSLWMTQILKEAKLIVRSLVRDEPDKTLLVSIDLTRSKDTIMAELKTCIDKAKANYLGKEPISRLKWLKKTKDILAVWDLWEKYGQKRCFRLISKDLNVRESTVKSRWRLAYKLIYHQEYDPVIARKQGKEKAYALCASCKDEKKCYKEIKGTMSFYPCPKYLKLAGMDYARECVHDNLDTMIEQSAYRSFISKNI